MRTRPVWARRELFGSEPDRVRTDREASPGWLVDLSGRLMQPLLFGRMKPFGLGPPQRRLSRVAEASGATLDSGFVADVKAGPDHARGRAWTASTGARSSWTTAQRIEVDVVIAGTGYTPALDEFLPADIVDDGWPIVGDRAVRAGPGLFTAGLNPATLTAFHPDFIAEAEQIADAIVDVARSPSAGR